MVSDVRAVSNGHSSTLSKRDHCDIAIVGGGLSGGLAAIHLARAGFRVVLFEKEMKPTDKVCGEFLSYESLPLLREVGIDPLFLGGTEITDFRVHGPQQTAATKLPRRAVGVTRKKLDEELLRIAKESGADIRRGVQVTEILEGLDETTGSILLGTSAGDMRAQRLIIATGTSEFKSLNERVGRDEGYVGFKMHIRLKPSIAALVRGHIDLFAFDRGYGGLTDLGGGLADFCFLIEKSALAKIGSDWESITAHVGRSNWSASHYLDGAEPLARQFTTLSALPYGFLRRTPPPAGVFFVGDQMAVIPSIMGDGMAIALMTARRAVDAIIEFAEGGSTPRLRFAVEASRAYQREARAALRPQVEAAMTLHALFKNPKLVDVATYAFRFVPGMFARVFKSTRCRLIDTTGKTKSLSIRRKSRLSTWSKDRFKTEIAPTRG